MSSAHRFAALLLLSAMLAVASAQIPGLSKPAADPKSEIPIDPLGRATPRGTIVEFTRAVDRADFATAALYLQLDKRHSLTPGRWRTR